MFKSKKDNNTELFAPVTGKAVSLTSVPDPVFAEKMMGEGLAFVPESNVFSAPADGTITMISPTNHAYGMTLPSGLEVLVHIGIDTVKLDGEGFQLFVKEGQKVKKGQKVIEADLDFIRSKDIPTITPMILLNHFDFKINEIIDNEDVNSGSVVVRYE